MEGIVQKEALYCAVGRCARSLKDVIDFEAALETTFIVEVRETNPEYVHLNRSLHTSSFVYCPGILSSKGV